MALDTPLMVWQRQVVEIATELEGGVPAYRQVFVTVPRQQGKTTLMLALLLWRCLVWAELTGRPQRCAYTAQDGNAGVQKWMSELVPLIEASPLKKFVKAVKRANGKEAVEFKNGSFIRIMPTSPSAGHGHTYHLVVLDEIWADTDDRREAAFRPTQIRVPDAQMLICSTAGHAGSTVYNRKVTLGRRAVTEDWDRTIAYFEWSAPEDVDIADEGRWAEWMSAIAEGIIDPSIIRDALLTEPESEFKRAYCNIPTASVDMVIPEAIWRQARDPMAKATGKPSFAVDVADDRSWASIVVYGDGVFEIVEQQPGTAWVVDACNRLPGPVALDFAGPAGNLAEKIKKVRKIQGRDVQQACAALFDAIIDGRVKFRAQNGFDEAVRGAAKRESGDVWSWGRKMSTSDITPLVAATLAYSGAGIKTRTGIGFS